MRTTPTAACEIEANIGPQDLRRQRTLSEAVERYKRKDKGHPNRNMVETWKSVKRIQQNTLLEIAKTEEELQHLPQEIEQEEPFSAPAPWKELCQANINTSLINKNVTKDSDPLLLKSSALETIDSYPTNAVHVYTDGSAFRKTKNAGFGTLLRYPDGSSFEYSDSCGKECSNYEAEVLAISTSIQIAHQQFDLNEKPPMTIVIFSDSKSTLESLKNPPYHNKEVGKLAGDIHNLLSSYDITSHIQWIPGHSDIIGNEKADKLAKSGANKPQKENMCSLTTVKQILKTNEKEDWLNRWAGGSTGRVLFREMAKPSNKDAINQLDRKDQCTIFQFRTQHAPTNYHLNRIKPQHEPHCRHCTHPYETAEHLLFHCPTLKAKRQELLPQQPTIHNTLYSTLGQLRRTSEFIRLALTA